MRLPPLLKGKSSEIRGSLIYTLLGKLIGCALWVLSSTWKHKIVFKFDRERMNAPYIYAIWHNRILGTPLVWEQMALDQKMSFLTSASKDGSLVAEALSLLGLQAVRGSSQRRGVAALMKMKHLMEEGSSITLTPDGPKGPLYNVKEGMLRLSQFSKYPILPVSIEFSSVWRVRKTWDGFCIPKPFSKVTVVINEPVSIPEDLTPEEFSRYAERIEQAMCSGLPDFSPIND